MRLAVAFELGGFVKPLPFLACFSIGGIVLRTVGKIVLDGKADKIT